MRGAGAACRRNPKIGRPWALPSLPSCLAGKIFAFRGLPLTTSIGSPLESTDESDVGDVGANRGVKNASVCVQPVCARKRAKNKWLLPTDPPFVPSDRGLGGARGDSGMSGPTRAGSLSRRRGREPAGSGLQTAGAGWRRVRGRCRSRRFGRCGPRHHRP